MRRHFSKILVVIIISFILQYLWEYWQCGIFYNMGADPLHSLLMWSATFGDVMMTVGLYLLLSAINKDFNWILNRWDIKEYLFMLFYALFFSFYFEASALHTGRWGYSLAMPLFPNTNIGLIPVLQLIILFPITFLISKFIIKLNFRT